MSYQVLALKWRPQVFEDLVGQDTVARTLQNAIHQDRVANAFLFSGVRGVGKTTTARILAKALNCAQGPTVRPCGQCPSCKEIAASRSLDVQEIDAASHTKVEEIREVIEASRYAPSRDRFKIYIIDEVHMLSTPSFNALLKTLEEPPPHVKFIFATTEYHKIPDTIVSRCQLFEFRTVPSDKIAGQLRKIAREEGLEISDEALAQLGRAAEGSLRDALSSLDQVVAAVGTRVSEKDVTELLGLVDLDVLHAAAKAIFDRKTGDILRIVDDLVRGGRELRSFARSLMQYFRDVLVAQVMPETKELRGVTRDEDLSELASRLSEEDLIRSLDVLSQAESALRWSPEPRFHLEVALLKLAELRRLTSFEELLSRFEALESARAPEPEVKKLKSYRSSEGTGTAGPRTQSTRSRASKEMPAKAGALQADPGPGKGQSAPEPTPPDTRTLSAEGVLEGVLEKARLSHPKLHALLSGRREARLEGDCLHIGLGAEQKILHNELVQEDSRRLIEQTVREVAGRPLRVEVYLSAPAESEPSEAADASGSEELRKRALSDSLLRRFVETFQGEVEDIRALPGRSGKGAPKQGR